MTFTTKNMLQYYLNATLVVAYQYWCRYFDYHNESLDSIELRLHLNPRLLPCPQLHSSQGLVGFLPEINQLMKYIRVINIYSHNYARLHFTEG